MVRRCIDPSIGGSAFWRCCNNAPRWAPSLPQWDRLAACLEVCLVILPVRALRCLAPDLLGLWL